MKKHHLHLVQLFLFAFIAAAGFAIGRFTVEPTVEVFPAEGSPRIVTVKDSADTNALTKARSEIEALKAENLRLRKAAESVETSVAAVEHNAPEQTAEAPQRQTWRERMEELRENDPERYAQEVERRNQFFNTMAQVRAEKVNFLDSIDTSLLSVEAQGIHARFTAALARQGMLQQEIAESLEAGETPSEELRAQMHDTFRELQETREAERTALLDAIAISMGLDEQDVPDFTALVGEVFDATSGQIMRRGMFRHAREMTPPAQ